MQHIMLLWKLRKHLCEYTKVMIHMKALGYSTDTSFFSSELYLWIFLRTHLFQKVIPGNWKIWNI